MLDELSSSFFTGNIIQVYTQQTRRIETMLV